MTAVATAPVGGFRICKLRRKGNAMTEGLQIYINEGGGYLTAGEDALASAKDSFEALGDTLTEAVFPLRRKLDQALGGPTEVELSIELALKAEAKWIVVSAGAQAAIRVRLAWKTASLEG